MNGLLLFLREVITNPTHVGAAFPSSSKLAQAMTQDVLSNQQNYVVELGAGTGVITEALLKSGVPAKNLIALERSTALVQHLRKRFSGINIIEGDAAQLADLVAEKKPVQAVVSGLPLRTWPKIKIEKIGEQIDKTLSPGGIFVQFTYSLFSKPLALSPKLKFVRHQYILWNLPPARIDVFRYVAD